MTKPQFIEPQLATLTDDTVEGPEWIFERKLDGIRLIVVRDGDDVHLWSRNQKDHTSNYPELTDAVRAMSVTEFVADAEVVAFEGSVTSFSRLQQRSGITDPDAARRSGIAVWLYVFDLLIVDGEDLRSRPLRERKSILRERFDFDDPIRFCRHRNESGPEVLEDACRRGWEGLIAKRADRSYRSGRSRDWLKLKCVARQEFVVVGFTDPQGDRNGLGALVLGYNTDDGEMRSAGRVGTGFDTAERDRLRELLDERRRSDAPIADADGSSDVHWVEPELVCEVGFTEWTTAGSLRHPRYLGLRDDKDASEVVRERAVSAP